MGLGNSFIKWMEQFTRVNSKMGGDKENALRPIQAVKDTMDISITGI